MRRIFAALAATAILAQPAITGSAWAVTRCVVPAEQAMFELAALKSELLVLAIGCKRSESYNAFINRYRAQLLDLDKTLNDHFKRMHGARWQKAADDFTTDMANVRSTVDARIGGDHCPRNGMIFNEVMALSGPSDLSAYAAGKDLLPDGTAVCTAPAVTRAATPSRTPAARAARPTHH